MDIFQIGPGELLVRYGTPEQKEYYLPKLANGSIVPCFGLTGPASGSGEKQRF